MKNIIISDATLRDGNHAVKHQLTLNDIKAYASAIDQVGVDIVEVGHGNGLGASSLQLGESAHSDRDILRTAKNELKHTKLGVHIIPGFGRVDKDMQIAIEEGVDVIRVASHCTEADLTERHIQFAEQSGCEVFGVLMMTHMADKNTLLIEAKKMQDFGAKAVILMDSAGAYLCNEVVDKITYLSDHLNIAIGFHAHNNLSLAVANSIAAVESGATIIDATASGFGAGAGNTPLEIIASLLKKMDYSTNINLYQLFDTIDMAKKMFIKKMPEITTLNLVSGLYGVFSGFIEPVIKAANKFNVDAREIFRKLGERKIIAGQEDLIIEVAKELQE